MQLIYLSLFALANAQLSEIPPRFSKLHHGKRNSLSTDGTCGVWRGIDTEVKCPRNNCCSVNGYCGMTNDYCGTGCQAKYGNCRGGWNPNPTPTPYETGTSTTAVPATTNAPTTTTVNSIPTTTNKPTTTTVKVITTVPISITTTPVRTTTTTSTPKPTSYPVSQDGFCGPVALTSCPAGQCCSDNGRCGSGVQFCGINRWACKPQFGQCGGPAPYPAAGSYPPINPNAYQPMVLKCNRPGVFALTYDDGVFNYTNQLLDILEANNVPATFFINAFNWGDITIEPYKSVFKRLYNSKHQLASHTYDHLDLNTANNDQLWAQMYRNDHAFKEVLGVRPIYMRPPYGHGSPETLTALNSWGYKAIWMNIDSGDVDHPEDPNFIEKSKSKYESILNKGDPKRDSYISLQHDTIQQTATEWTKVVIPMVRSKGYQFVTVGDCLGEPNKNQWYRV